MLKQPWHLTSFTTGKISNKKIKLSENYKDPKGVFLKFFFIHSLLLQNQGEMLNSHTMKKEFGDCTSRLSLCFLFSSSAGGFNRSISFWRTYEFPRQNTKKVNTCIPKTYKPLQTRSIEG